MAVNPSSLATRRADWVKVVKVWDRVVKYVNDPKTADDAVKIMAARVGVSPEEYKPFLAGTKLLTLEEGKKVFEKADGLRLALRLVRRSPTSSTSRTTSTRKRRTSTATSIRR